MRLHGKANWRLPWWSSACAPFVHRQQMRGRDHTEDTCHLSLLTRKPCHGPYGTKCIKPRNSWEAGTRVSTLQRRGLGLQVVGLPTPLQHADIGNQLLSPRQSHSPSFHLVLLGARCLQSGVRPQPEKKAVWLRWGHLQGAPCPCQNLKFPLFAS